jgi:hypothetical protein
MTSPGWAAALTLAAAGGVLSGLPSHAQQIWPEVADQQAEAAESAPAETNDADDVDMSGVDINNLDWSQLTVDAVTLMNTPAAKARQANGATASGGMAWSGNNKQDGGSSVSVKQSISPFWNTQVGADMTVTHEPATMSELLEEKATNGGGTPQSSGSAWASMTGPGAGSIWDKTAIEARLDPSQDRSKLGTSLSKSVPLNGQYSLTLQNGYNMTQQGVVPVPGIGGNPARSYETDQTAKLNIGDTGTSVTAGQTMSSTDDKWLRSIGAEQKLFDGVSVSGSIGETAQGATNKSISAGFKRSW